MTFVRQQRVFNSARGRFSPPTCTVVVCTRNRPEQLRRCILQLRNQTFRSFEILVVDNNFHASEARKIAAELNAAYVLCRRPGLSAARNTGLRSARTEFVAFIDDDAVADRWWLANLLCEFHDDQVICVTGQIQYETAENDVAAAEPPSYRRVDRNTPDWFAMANFGGLGDGANMAFRRSVIPKWHGFDERLGRGALFVAGEEHHAFFRLIDLGHAVIYTPDAIVLHPAQDTGSSLAPLRPIAMSTAYITLLSIEHPRYWRAIARFISESVRRTPHGWGKRSEKVFSNCQSRWRVYLAMMVGPLIYLYVRVAAALQPSLPASAWISTVPEFRSPRARPHSEVAEPALRRLGP